MSDLDYFPWYHSYLKKTAKLTDSELGRLVRSLTKYSMTGETEQLNGREEMVFEFMAFDIDRAKENYLEKCEIRSERGKKGAKNRWDNKMLNDANDACATVSINKMLNDAYDGKSESKSKSKSESNIISCCCSADARENDLQGVVDAYMQRLGEFLSSSALDDLRKYHDLMGGDVLLHAMDAAADAGKLTWAYIRGILRNYQQSKVKCLDDVLRLEKEREEASAHNSAQSGQGFVSRKAREMMPSCKYEPVEIDELKRRLDMV